jgi:hypothetical protein
MPAGLRLVRWQPKVPPVILTHCSVVNDVDKFTRYTLEQLGHALAGRNWQAGNWSAQDLLQRLEQVGMVVQLESNKEA